VLEGKNCVLITWIKYGSNLDQLTTSAKFSEISLPKQVNTKIPQQGLIFIVCITGGIHLWQGLSLACYAQIVEAY